MKAITSAAAINPIGPIPQPRPCPNTIVPFDAAAALRGTRRLLRTYPQVCTNDRFSSGFNPTVEALGNGWLSEGWYGLDQGLLVMMIENYRTGLIWEITRKCPVFRAGLVGAGFAGGWL